ncbi:putative Zinc/iron permease [[Clostridium] ultunense Esp]|nr:putative Zinc/iron permease [[Clostridium] ultunense Esp]
MEVWTVVGYGFFLGWVGMNMGGILAYALGKFEQEILHLLVFMTVGALYTIVFSQILPESLALGGFGMTIIGFALGALFAFWLESFSHHFHLPAHSKKWDAFMKSGFLLAIAIGFHNFPSGIALGSTLTHSPSLAHGLSIALMLHNVPEGIALGIPLVLAEIGVFAFFLISTLVAIPIGLGAYAGSLFGHAVPGSVSLLLGFSIGTILYVTYAEIFLPLWEKEKRKGLGIITLLVGGILAYFFLALLHLFPAPHHGW